MAGVQMRQPTSSRSIPISGVGMSPGTWATLRPLPPRRASWVETDAVSFSHAPYSFFLETSNVVPHNPDRRHLAQRIRFGMGG